MFSYIKKKFHSTKLSNFITNNFYRSITKLHVEHVIFKEIIKLFPLFLAIIIFNLFILFLGYLAIRDIYYTKGFYGVYLFLFVFNLINKFLYFYSLLIGLIVSFYQFIFEKKNIYLTILAFKELITYLFFHYIIGASLIIFFYFIFVVNVIAIFSLLLPLKNFLIALNCNAFLIFIFFALTIYITFSSIILFLPQDKFKLINYFINAFALTVAFIVLVVFKERVNLSFFIFFILIFFSLLFNFKSNAKTIALSFSLIIIVLFFSNSKSFKNSDEYKNSSDFSIEFIYDKKNYAFYYKKEDIESNRETFYNENGKKVSFLDIINVFRNKINIIEKNENDKNFLSKLNIINSTKMNNIYLKHFNNSYYQLEQGLIFPFEIVERFATKILDTSKFILAKESLEIIYNNRTYYSELLNNKLKNKLIENNISFPIRTLYGQKIQENRNYFFKDYNNRLYLLSFDSEEFLCKHIGDADSIDLDKFLFYEKTRDSFLSIALDFNKNIYVIETNYKIKKIINSVCLPLLYQLDIKIDSDSVQLYFICNNKTLCYVFDNYFNLITKKEIIL